MEWREKASKAKMYANISIFFSWTVFDFQIVIFLCVFTIQWHRCHMISSISDNHTSIFLFQLVKQLLQVRNGHGTVLLICELEAFSFSLRFSLFSAHWSHMELILLYVSSAFKYICRFVEYMPEHYTLYEREENNRNEKICRKS